MNISYALHRLGSLHPGTQFLHRSTAKATDCFLGGVQTDARQHIKTLQK